MGGNYNDNYFINTCSIIIILLFYNYYHTQQINKKVVQERVNYTENCKINRYEKKYSRWLKKWEIVDKLNNSQPIVIVYDLPKDIAEEIINDSLKLIEEKRK